MKRPYKLRLYYRRNGRYILGYIGAFASPDNAKQKALSMGDWAYPTPCGFQVTDGKDGPVVAEEKWWETAEQASG